MTNFEKLKSLDIDQLVDWLAELEQFDSSPWSLWFDCKYCKHCEDIICKSADDVFHSRCAYCEVYDECRFFDDMNDVPNEKETIKMWLEAEAEE